MNNEHDRQHSFPSDVPAWNSALLNYIQRLLPPAHIQPSLSKRGKSQHLCHQAENHVFDGKTSAKKSSKYMPFLGMNLTKKIIPEGKQECREKYQICRTCVGFFLFLFGSLVLQPVFWCPRCLLIIHLAAWCRLKGNSIPLNPTYVMKSKWRSPRHSLSSFQITCELH